MAVFSLAVATTLIVALGLPSNLFGSAPREQIRSAASGEVSVVDGETLRLGQHTLRLIGLDAPGRGEICLASDGRRFDCGAAAAEALSRLLAGRALECRVQANDRFGRGLARCQAGGTDVNAALVAAGFAVADARPGLRTSETEARSASRGLWGAGAPESWRTRR